MKAIPFFCLLIFIISCTTTKNTIKSDKLNGTWVPTKQEMGGALLPKAAFELQKLTISNDSNYTFVAESVDKGVIRYHGNKMDIYGKEGVNTGKHFAAIYKYENGELTVCYNLAGNSYPEGFDTKGQPLFFLSVFKKE